MKVFVYGTLKKGQRAHRMLSKSPFLGEVRTHSRYHLYSYGWYPGMLEGSPKGNGVLGELYEVDDATMAKLDRYEGDPELFERTLIDLETGDTAFGYLYQRGRGEELVEGVWVDDSDR